jgi:hypothetical protein
MCKYDNKEPKIHDYDEESKELDDSDPYSLPQLYTPFVLQTFVPSQTKLEINWNNIHMQTKMFTSSIPMLHFFPTPKSRCSHPDKVNTKSLSKQYNQEETNLSFQDGVYREGANE